VKIYNGRMINRWQQVDYDQISYGVAR